VQRNTRLVDIGVLEEDYTSESPTFAIAKKNRTIRGTIGVVSYSRKVSSTLKVTHFQYQRLGT
jgi:hypothetical protein